MSVQIESLHNYRNQRMAEIRRVQFEEFPLVPNAPEGFFGENQQKRYLAMNEMMREVAPKIAAESGQQVSIYRDFSRFSNRGHQAMTYFLTLNDPLEDGQAYPKNYGIRIVTLQYDPGSERFSNRESLTVEPTAVTSPNFGRTRIISLEKAKKALEEARPEDMLGRTIKYSGIFSRYPEALRRNLADTLRIGMATPLNFIPRW